MADLNGSGDGDGREVVPAESRELTSIELAQQAANRALEDEIREEERLEAEAEARRQKHRQARRYPWQEIKQVFVEGRVLDTGERDWPSMTVIADLMGGLNPTRIREKAAREKWTDQRAAFQAHLQKVRQERRAAALSKDAVDLDSKALTVAKMGVQLVTVRVGEIVRAVQEKQQAKARGEDDDDFGLPAVDARELDTLARAAAAWHALGGKALGEVETTRTELTGVGGEPLQVRHSVKEELARDDPERLYAFAQALERAGIALSGGRAAIGPAGQEGSPS